MDPIAEAYLHSLTYHSMVDALERIAAKHDPENAMDVSMLRTRIVTALGEIGGVWPMDCFTGSSELHGLAYEVMDK